MSVIKIENLWKEYRLGVIGHGTLTHDLQSWWARFRGKEDPNAMIASMLKGQEKQIDGDRFWALRDINLEIKQGEVLGIIGKNGAGKSTLLKILSRVTAPTKGMIKVKGRIASLLEVGTGFHPELTGRENIFMNGAILGMSMLEIKAKLDEIINFSGVEDFVDTPVKRYSSGMYVRLAFAVAAHLDPDILVVDEVLAVGDIEFQKKCLGRMDQISKQGRTVLFVSHNLGAISKICRKSVVLQDGKIAFSGDSRDGIGYYRDHAEKHTVLCNNEYDGRHPLRYPIDLNKSGQIIQLSMCSKGDVCGVTFKYTESIIVYIDIVLREVIKGCYLLIHVKDHYDNYLLVSADNDMQETILCAGQPNTYHCKVQLPRKILKPGQYLLGVSLTQTNKIKGPIDKYENAVSFTIIDNETYRASVSGYRDASIVAPELMWKLSLDS